MIQVNRVPATAYMLRTIRVGQRNRRRVAQEIDGIGPETTS
jgi:hypothetical protein